VLLANSSIVHSRPERRHRRHDDEIEVDDGRALAASDAPAPSPTTTTLLAHLLAPAPAPAAKPAKPEAAALKTPAPAPSKPGSKPTQEAAAGAAAAAGPPAPAKDNEDEEEDEGGEGEQEQNAENEDRDTTNDHEPKTQAALLEDVVSAYRAPSASAQPPVTKTKKVKFLARGANKAIPQSEVDPASLSDKKGSFAFYGRWCGPGYSDAQGRPGIDAVDEACHQHDLCYGKAQQENPEPHKVRRATAECGCDKTLVKALRDFKGNKTEQARATKAAKRAANDMIELFDLKCPIAVAGAVLKPPTPPGKKGSENMSENKIGGKSGGGRKWFS